MATKLCFLDVETTSRYAYGKNRGGIWQLACEFYNDHEPAGTLKMCMNPGTEVTIEDEALAVGGITRADLEQFHPSQNAYDVFVEQLDKQVSKFDKKDKLWFVAYNADFDWNFVKQWFYSHGNKFFMSYFHNPPICMYNAAGLQFVLKGTLPEKKMNLKDMAEHFGVEPEGDWHDAKTDVQVTRKIFYKLKEMYDLPAKV